MITGTENGRTVKIKDRIDDLTMPLKVSVKKRKKNRSSRILIRCGCCEQRLEICPIGEDIPNLVGGWSLEINGVFGTIDQWKQVLLPLLGMDTSK